MSHELHTVASRRSMSPSSPGLLRQERGIGLLAAILVMLLISVMGASMMVSGVTDLGTSANYRSAKAALYEADSGLERSMADFLNDMTWASSMVNGANNPIQPLTTFPTSVTVNGHTINIATDGSGNLIPDWYPFGPTTTLGGGTYAREIFLPPVNFQLANGKGSKAWITMPLRSTGTAAAPDTSTQVVQADLEVLVFRVAVWDNAIFTGSGQAGQQISGNVQVRGSIHAVGDPNNPTVLDWTGGSAIHNNYANASDSGNFDVYASKLPPPPTRNVNGEVVQTLDAEFRVKHGTISLDGQAEAGEADVTGDVDKELLDGIFTDSPIQYQSGSAETHTDYEGEYDIPIDVPFPSLSDPYTDPSNNTWASHRDYLTANGLVLPVSTIDDSTPAFSLSDANGNSVTWDPSSQTLDVQGIVQAVGDLTIGRDGGPNRVMNYSGTGTLYASNNIDVMWSMIPTGDYLDPTDPTTDNLGLIADSNLTLGTNSQLTMFAAVYAEDNMFINKQTRLAGATVANYFDMGDNVPRIWQVPRLSSTLPPGMPGANPILVPSQTALANWTQLRR